MPEVPAAALEQHLAACEACQKALMGLDDSTDSLVGRLKHIRMDAAGDAALAGLLTRLAEWPVPRPTAAVDDALPQIGRYQLLVKIGQGGGGVVYSARHLDLEKIVALKVLSAERLHHPQAQSRFLREMRAVGRLDHPNVVRAFDAGRYDQQPYLAMELIRGVVVSRIARQAQPLRVANACELIRQAACGLAAAHRAGLIHRDIKPANLIVTDDGLVKVLDLGLALFETPEDNESLTGEGRVVGTASYVAPEQALQDANVDFRADLYSAGATLFKLLTGQSPFSGADYDTPLKKVLGHVRDEPPRMESLRSDVPPALCDLIARLLAKSPADRLDSADALAQALSPFADGADLAELVRQVRSLPDGAAHEEEDTRRSLSAVTPGDAPRPAKLRTQPRRGPAAKLWVAVIVGVAAAALLLLSRQHWKAPDQQPEVIATPPALQPTAAQLDTADAAAEISQADLAKYQSFLAPRASHQGGAIHALAYSTDGAWLAAGGSNVQICVWNVTPWNRLADIRDYPFGIKSVRFFPDKRRLLAISTDVERGRGMARIWDLPQEGKAAKLFGSYDDVRWADISPDGGLWASVGYNAGLRIRELPGGKMVKQFNADKGTLVRFSPNGKFVAMLDLRGRGQLVQAPDWSVQRYFTSSQGPIRDVAISADSSLLATCGGSDGRAFISTWNATTLVERHVASYESSPAQQIALLPENRALVLGAHDDALRVWDLTQGRLIQKDRDREQSIGSMAVSPDGKQVAVGRLDGSIEISHFGPTGKLVESGHRKHPAVHKHRETILAAAFSPNSRLIATAGDDGEIMISEIASGRMVLRLNIPRAGVGGTEREAVGSFDAVAFSVDGTQLAAGGLRSNAVRIWEVASGRFLHALAEGSQTAAVSYSPSGRWLALGGRDVGIYDVSNGRLIRPVSQFDADKFFCHSVDFSPDELWLATGGLVMDDSLGQRRERGCVIVWDVASGKEVQRVWHEAGKITCVRFHPDGKRLAYGGFDKDVQLFCVAAAQSCGAIPVPMGNVFAFNQDGTRIFAPGGCWDVSQGRKLLVSKARPNIFGLAVTANGKYLATVRNELLIELVAEMEPAPGGK